MPRTAQISVLWLEENATTGKVNLSLQRQFLRQAILWVVAQEHFSKFWGGREGAD